MGRARNWVVVTAGFASNFLNGAFLQVIGVYMVAWQKHFATDAGSIAVIASELSLVSRLSGLFAGALSKRFGCRNVLLLSGVTAMLSTFLGSFATELWHLYIFALASGLSYGLGYPPSVITVSYRFKERLGLANGIVSSGIGFGILVMAPVIEIMCEKYGWQGALLVHSAITAHRIAFALLMTPSAQEKRALRHNRRRVKWHHHTDIVEYMDEEAALTERTEVDREILDGNSVIVGEMSRYRQLKELENETKPNAKNEEDTEMPEAKLRSQSFGEKVEVAKVTGGMQLEQLHSKTSNIKEEPVGVSDKKVESDEDDDLRKEEQSANISGSQIKDETREEKLASGREECDVKEMPLVGQHSSEERLKCVVDRGQDKKEDMSNRCPPEMREGKQHDEEVGLEKRGAGCNPTVLEDDKAEEKAENEKKPQNITTEEGHEDGHLKEKDGQGRDYYNVREKGLETDEYNKAKVKSSQRHGLPFLCLRCKQILKVLNDTFDFTYLLGTPSFSILLVVVLGITMSCIPFRYYIPSKLVYDLDIPRIDASIAVTVLGACITVSRALHGLLLDFGVMSIQNLFLLCTTLSAVGLLMNPVTDAFAGQLVSAAIVGLCDGVTLPILNLFAKELVGPEKLPNAFGFHYFLGGVGMMIGIQLMGRLYDVTGSYDIPFYVAGAVQCFATLLLCYLVKCSRWRTPRVVKNESSS